MKVLASAYGCEPGLGSEAGIGWNWARQIARRHDLTLITRENNVAAIEAAAKEEGFPIRVVGHDLPYWMRFWKRKGRFAMAYFYLWQRSLARVGRKLDEEHDFDVLHHLTFASSWIPNGFAELDKPFVWGPVGQHPRVPAEYLSSTMEAYREAFKAFVRRNLTGRDPSVTRTMEAADVILSLGEEFRVPLAYRSKVMPMLACGTVDRGDASPRERGETFEVLFSGRLVDLKGTRLALEAFAHLAAERPEARLTFLGEGPNRSVLEERITELGLEDRVTLRGNLPHEDALAEMHRAHVFLFPSFEGAGMVVPEAMIAGNPVVCLDFGGPGEMVGEDRGIRVPLGDTPTESAQGLGDALLRLADDEQLRLSLARTALAWARQVTTWEAKGDRLAQIYSTAIDRFMACPDAQSDMEAA